METPRNSDNYDISIHAPREGCDQEEAERLITAVKFQSTHPVRGATYGVLVELVRSLAISIHAPREGCDHAHLFMFNGFKTG